jgi:hypothetical protein
VQVHAKYCPNKINASNFALILVRAGLASPGDAAGEVLSLRDRAAHRPPEVISGQLSAAEVHSGIDVHSGMDGSLRGEPVMAQSP